MKKLLALVLALCMVFVLCACGAAEPQAETSDAEDSAAAAPSSDVKIGVILVGDETEGYTLAHMEGIEEAMDALDLAEDQVIFKKSIPESSECYDTAQELIESDGCTAIFSNSYGHQNYMVQAAEDYEDVAFVSMTGDFAAISGCDNFSNAFTNVYESRYVSGVVAGMKLQELDKAGEIKDKNKNADGTVKVGYVGAFNYAEVVSGYTAFYLGLTSVYPNASMEVDYTNSWFDVDKEAAMAEKFISDGCIIISQHADSTGAPSACEKALKDGTTVYSVGYNVDMLDVAPNAALTSAGNVWGVYYTYAFQQLLDGKPIKTDWAEGYNEDAVRITPLGKSCAEGTEEKVEEVIAGLKDGSIQVFDTDSFTVSEENIAITKEKGNNAIVTTDAKGHVTSAKEDLSHYSFSSGAPELEYEGEIIEAIKDGAFAESEARSAPYFTLRIDGITELS